MKHAVLLVAAGFAITGCTTDTSVAPDSNTATPSVTARRAPPTASQGRVIVSAQGDCNVGPTNDNHLLVGQTAYVWLVFNSPTTVQDFTYEITGTSNSFDSGIVKIRFKQCTTNTKYWVAKFTT